MIAFLEARRAGLLRRGEIWRNVVAGVVVGVVALPLAMAFAIASGAEPEQGIWVGQWKYFFGLNTVETGTHFHEKTWVRSSRS